VVIVKTRLSHPRGFLLRASSAVDVLVRHFRPLETVFEAAHFMPRVPLRARWPAVLAA
jgi:hypothetical protein